MNVAAEKIDRRTVHIRTEGKHVLTIKQLGSSFHLCLPSNFEIVGSKKEVLREVKRFLKGKACQLPSPLRSDS